MLQNSALVRAWSHGVLTEYLVLEIRAEQDEFPPPCVIWSVTPSAKPWHRSQPLKFFDQLLSEGQEAKGLKGL